MLNIDHNSDYNNEFLFDQKKIKYNCEINCAKG